MFNIQHLHQQPLLLLGWRFRTMWKDGSFAEGTITDYDAKRRWWRGRYAARRSGTQPYPYAPTAPLDEGPIIFRKALLKLLKKLDPTKRTQKEGRNVAKRGSAQGAGRGVQLMESRRSCIGAA